MKVILAVGNEHLENYIASIDGIEVVDKLQTGQKILSSVKTNEVSLIFIYHKIPKFENKLEIIRKISKVQNLRVIYLYGSDDIERKYYIDYLISNGVYDYAVGELGVEIINNLIFHKKSRDDVKHEILEEENKLLKKDKIKSSDEKIEPSVKVKQETITEIIYQPYTLKQKVITTTGVNGAGKTSFSINMAIGLAKGLKESVDTNILLADFSFKKPDISYQLDLTDDERNLNELIAKIKAKELSNLDFEKNLITPFKDLPNLKILNGMVEMNSEYTKLNNEDLTYLLNTMKNINDIIIIDTDGNMENEFTQFAYANANMNMYVMEFNLAQLEHTKRSMLSLKDNKNINFDIRKYFLIINKYFESKELEISDFADCLEIENVFKINANIPLFTESINQSKPIMISENEEGEIARNSIMSICESIHPIKVNVKVKKGILSSIKSKFKKK